MIEQLSRVRLFSGGRAAVAMAVLGALVLLSIGCGPGAKGESLVELEALREANYTRTMRTDPAEVANPRVQEIRQRAFETMGESDSWYDAAVDAWEAAEGETSEELARQGVLLYRAAQAYSRAADARDSIENSNATYQNQLERRNQYNDMLAANEEVIELLTAFRTLYDRTEDCRTELRGFSAEAEAERRATYGVAQARSVQRSAENRRANEHAGAVYEEGTRLLANAAEYVEAQQYDLAFDTAALASTRFREAMTQSESEFQDLQADLLRSSAHESLFEAAVERFGDDAYIDGRGLVVVVRDLFADRRTDIKTDKTYLLDQLADLIENNRRIDVTVEGHTSDSGSRDQNLGTSRQRAEGVREYLVAQGARSSQISVTGLGEDYPRYDNRTNEGRADNNRVELVFQFD